MLKKKAQPTPALDPSFSAKKPISFCFRLRLEWLWPEGRFIPVRDAIDSMLS